MRSQSSKNPQAPSAKTHSFLRKSTDESPSFKTTSTSVPSEVRTSQSTNSLSPRSNESNHPEEDDVISDDDKTPEEKAAADLRANQRRGYDPNSSSIKIIQASFREWDHPFPRLPHSRVQSKRRGSSRILIRMNLARLSRLCTERANPLLHQFYFTTTLVERCSSVQLCQPR